MTIHFDSSVLKIRKDGARVLSSTLEKGEKLADGRTYAEVKKGVFPKAPEPEQGGLTLNVETNSSTPTGVGPSGEQKHAEYLEGNAEPATTGLTLDETKTSTVSADVAEKSAKSAKSAKSSKSDKK